MFGKKRGQWGTNLGGTRFESQSRYQQPLLIFRSFSLSRANFKTQNTSQPPPSIKSCTLEFVKLVEEMSLGDLLIYDTPNKCPDGTLKEAAVASLQVFTLILYIQRCKRLS